MPHPEPYPVQNTSITGFKTMDHRLLYCGALCRASYCEIYNEALYDLLKFSKQQLPVRWDAHRGFHAPDLMQRDCSTMADLMQAGPCHLGVMIRWPDPAESCLLERWTRHKQNPVSIWGSSCCSTMDSHAPDLMRLTHHGRPHAGVSPSFSLSCG